VTTPLEPVPIPAHLAAIVTDFVTRSGDPAGAVEAMRELLHILSPTREQPVDRVRWVPIEKVDKNSWNPNHVAQVEMRLLLRSIQHDGYTQPIVTVYDAAADRFEIVDGFHRYFVMTANDEVRASCHGRLPVVVLDKPVADRMAATVRHNRARGRHSVTGMSALVFRMLDEGMDDAAICNELGMEAGELVRLKHITGFSKLFADAQYHRAWVTRHQIAIRRAHEAKVAAAATPAPEVP